MALRPALNLRPALLDFPLSLPAGAPRVLLVNAIGGIAFAQRAWQETTVRGPGDD